MQAWGDICSSRPSLLLLHHQHKGVIVINLRLHLGTAALVSCSTRKQSEMLQKKGLMVAALACGVEEEEEEGSLDSLNFSELRKRRES